MLYAEIAALADDLTNREITISDGGAQNYVMIRFNSGNSNWIYTRVNLGVGYEYYNIDTNHIITDFNKIALRFQDNNFATFINGVKIKPQLSGNTFGVGVLNKISFARGTGGQPFYGKTKNLQVFNYALTDEELQTLTT